MASGEIISSDEIRKRFLAYFKGGDRKHAIIPSASLVPENDPTVLFNTAGMQPLVPYLLGEKHPMGTRLADVQKCVRTGDIDDIGDNRHLTFFEMLGNWSLGDYFKEDAIRWSMEFLTSKEEGLGLDPKRLFVTVFRGENGIPRDNDAIAIWKEEFKKKGIDVDVAGENGNAEEYVGGNVRIVPLGVADNFWIAGATGPCGGDTEIFYDTKPEAGKLEGKFSDLIDSFRIIEIWNNVFMEFNKTPAGTYEKLPKPNVDTGMGLERTTAVINGKDNVFDTDCFLPIMAEINKHTKVDDEKAKRVVADHIRTAVFMTGDGVIPSNTDRGYILRRIIRRAVRYADKLSLPAGFISSNLTLSVIEKYSGFYTDLPAKQKNISSVILEEEEKFRKTLARGIKIFESEITGKKILSGKEAFDLYQSYGFPIELTKELAKEKGIDVDMKKFETEMKLHQDTSRIGAEKKFKGGLGDTSEMSVRYHTATHLLNAALREVLGAGIMQKGSNITPERLRFDFSYGQKMTDDEKRRVEEIVNKDIKAALPVSFKEMPKEEAEKTGAVHAFGEKYGDIVKVYSIGDEKTGVISQEFCGGPHVTNTSELGTFKIQKEEAVSAGVRRIKAILS